jgi:transcriptional regulator with XRE-family HTH domain
MMRLRTLRTQAGLSAEKLGRRADISMHAILRIEQGRANPTLRTLRKLASALNVSPDELMQEAAPPQEHKEG